MARFSADGQEPKRATDVLRAGLLGALTLAITASGMDLGEPREFVERTIGTILNGLAREVASP